MKLTTGPEIKYVAIVVAVSDDSYQNFMADSVWDTEALAQQWCRELSDSGAVTGNDRVSFLFNVQPVNLGHA